MSVIRSSLLSSNATLGEDQNYNVTITHDWIVETNAVDDGPVVVYAQMGLAGPVPVPDLWSTYNLLTGTITGTGTVAYLTSRKIARFDNGDPESAKKQWKVTCTWTVPQGNSGVDPPTANPLLEPVKYSLEWAPYTRLIDRDVNGNPITNGAGDEFDPPVQRDDYRPVLVAVRNMWPLQDVINLALTYKNAVNSSTFYGAPAGFAKVESIAAGQVQQRNSIQFYQVTIRIQFTGVGTGTADPQDSWLVRLVDRGRHFVDANGKKAVPFEMKLKAGASAGSTNPNDYEEVAPKVPLEFVNLNNDGSRRFPDYAPAILTGTAYQIYPSVNFSGLGI